jgi:hypothetical protein
MIVMPTVLSVLIIAIIILLYQNKSYILEELPAFVEEYKKSNFYWISAFIGGIYGSTGSILQKYSTLIVLLIFILPAVSYYIYGKPFGLWCEYSPVDKDKNLIDSVRKKKMILPNLMVMSVLYL